METYLNIKISISILTYNRCSVLKILLLSLQNIKYTPFELIVVDNHSEDNTKEMIHNEFPNIKYYRTSKNIGAAARNIGIKNASGSIIIMLDDDIIGINDSELKRIVSCFSKRPKLGAINFKILDYFNGNICNWPHHCDPGENSRKEFMTYEITEGAVAFRKEALKIAGYYPDFFFLSHEGLDLALRIINCGYEIIYSDIVSVKHYHVNLGRKKWYNYYFDTRNQIWLAVRNFPVSYAFTYLLRGLSSMLIYSIRDGYIFYWAKAVRDGIKGIDSAMMKRNVLNKGTMDIIKDIDKKRPGLLYYLKTRVIKGRARL